MPFASREKAKEWRTKYREENRERINLKAKERYHKNLEESRAKCRRRKKNQSRDKINKRQREWYARNRKFEAVKQNARRIKREPYRGLKRAILDYERGDLKFSELIKLLRERYALSFRNDPTASRFRPDIRRLFGKNDEGFVEGNLRSGSDENRCDKSNALDCKR